VNKHRRHLYSFSLLFTVYFSASLSGQSSVPPPADTTKQTQKPLRKQDLEGPILYEARHILNLMDEKMTVLTGQAKVNYQDMTLTGARITVDWDKRLMVAEALPDSVWAKKEGGDSVKVLGLTGLPEFKQADDVMKGEAMTFNFKTKRGRVLRGRTKFEDGYYHGDALKMMNSKTLNVADGRFTTCDLDTNPHYHFWSKQMKILVNDKVIAKPIVLFAGHIPVLALPFGLFPVKKGRHSGFLIPRYGESSVEGRYLRGIGYYWAPSDYWDVKPTLDFFEKSGFLFGADLNYNVRYKLSGRVYGSWTRKNFSIDNQEERRWDLNIQHSQQLSPSARLTVNANLVSSGNFYRQLSPSREYRLQQEIRSNANLTKQFGGSWNVGVNLNQTRSLQNQAVSEILPQITISRSRTPLFPKPKAKKGGRAETHWYDQIYLSYSSKMLSRRDVKLVDSNNNTYSESRGKGWDHALGFSSTQKILGWLNLTPSVNYRETWYDSRNVYALDPASNRIVTGTQSGFFARRTYDVSASFGTKIYGTFYPRIFKNVIIRHEARPSLSLTYQPDFGDARYGYFQAVEDTSGKTTFYDRYNNSLFPGGTPREGRKGLNIGLSNLFQMKIGEGEKAKKIDLFNYDLSTAYNWKAKEYKFSDLTSAFRANPSQNLDFNLSARYSFYQTGPAGTRINRLWTDRIDWGNWKSIFSSRWLRLTSMNADVNFRLAGKAGAKGESSTPGPAGETPFGSEAGLESLSTVSGDRFDPYAGTGSRSDFSIPWNLSGSLSYSEDRTNPLDPQKTYWVRSSLEFNLSRNWKVSYDTQIDLKLKKPVSQDISLFRDLHCWEAQILWTPTGYNKRFYFRINIKSPMLKELKFEKGTGSRGLYGY
jgi:hypothetical protein